MQIFPSQLAATLKDGLHAIFVIGGTELALEEEARNQIVAAARTNGLEDIEILRLDDRTSRTSSKSFPWAQIFDELSSSSLFGTRKVLEVRMQVYSFDNRAITFFDEYVQHPTGNVLLVRLAGLAYREKRLKWYATLRGSRDIALIIADELDRRDFIKWLRSRAATLDLQLAASAAEKLADYCDGNLIAARQELDKLKLVLSPSATVNVEDIELSDSSNTDLFELLDAVYSGNTALIAKRLDALNNQGGSSRGYELGALRLLMQTLTVTHSQLIGVRVNIPQYQRKRVDVLARRHGLARIEALLVECAQFESIFLGLARGDLANLFRNLLYAIAGASRTQLDDEYHWRKIDRLIN